jgi:hypothetical protein
MMDRWGGYLIFKPTIFVHDLNNQGCTCRHSLSNTGKKDHHVMFDRLSASPTIATLSSVKFMIDEIDIQREIRRQSLDDCQSTWPMGFTSGAAC